MKKPVGIQTYLWISHGFLLILSVAVIAFAWSRNIYQITTQELQSIMRERVMLISRIIDHEFAEHENEAIEQVVFPQNGLDEDILAVYIDQAGVLSELVPGSDTPGRAKIFSDLNADYLAAQSGDEAMVGLFNSPVSVYAVAPVYGAGTELVGTVCLLLPIPQLEAYTNNLRAFIMIAVLLVTIISALVSTFLTSYLSRQFAQAERMAANIAAGDYDIEIPETGPAEMRALAHYLNEMANTLQEQSETRRTLLANVAHELARPLSGIQLGIESLRKGANKDSELADDLLVSMGYTLHRMEDLIDDITLAARPESTPIDIHLSEVAVRPFLEGIAARFRTVADSREIAIVMEIAEGLPLMMADEKRLNQIMGNLIDNAVKFSSPGKKVRIVASQFNKQIQIQVRDQGIGIQPEELEMIFKPFYQGSIGRRIKQGMGLGLTISRQLAEAQGGTLNMEISSGGGIVATLRLIAAGS